MDIILQGGWVLWLLTLLSVYSLASIAWLALNAAKVVVKQPARGEGQCGQIIDKLQEVCEQSEAKSHDKLQEKLTAEAFNHLSDFRQAMRPRLKPRHWRSSTAFTLLSVFLIRGW